VVFKLIAYVSKGSMINESQLSQSLMLSIYHRNNTSITDYSCSGWQRHKTFLQHCHIAVRVRASRV